MSHYDPNPYLPQPQWPPPRKSSKTVYVILACVGVGAAVCCAACCGIFGFALHSAFNEDSEKLTSLLKDNPIVLDKLGGIEDCRVNYAQSLQTDENTNVFDVRGPKGSGQLIAEEGGDDFISVKLRTKDGEWELLGDDEEQAVKPPVTTPAASRSPQVPTAPRKRNRPGAGQ